ncbi:MAG: hypothetical protein WC374_07395 [Phycisphaerae bacterium]
MALCAPSVCDTFTNKTTGEILHGYLKSGGEQGNLVICTGEKDERQFNLSQWDWEIDRLGRKNKITVISLEDKLDLHIVCDALDAAIATAADDGPLFILLEMNCPGGQAEYIEKICDRLIRTDYCPVVGLIKSGPYGGALSGAAALALACDKIYMEPGTTIGAAAIFTGDRSTEKLSIAWQDYIGTLTRRKGRPELLARAMVDKDIEVIEVAQDGRRLFIQPSQAKSGQSVVRVWSPGGSLLTLTAGEAVRCNIADAIVIDRADVLRKMSAAGAEVVVDTSTADAARTFKKAQLKFDRLRNSLDGRIKQIERADNLQEAINLLREIKFEYQSMLSLAKRYPDLYLDVELIEEQLDSAEDYYRRAKVKKRELAGVNDVNTVD